MKPSLFYVFLFLVIFPLSAQDFRNASWSNSKATVKASESDADWEEYSDGIYEILGFETTIVGLQTIVGYLFVDDKLVRTMYFFNESHVLNNNLYIEEFERIDELLQTKYGKGDKEEIWANDAFKSNPSMHGDAIGYGHYEIYVNWEVPGKTTISHSLTAGDTDIEHRVQYYSIELEDYVKEAEMELF